MDECLLHGGNWDESAVFVCGYVRWRKHKAARGCSECDAMSENAKQCSKGLFSEDFVGPHP